MIIDDSIQFNLCQIKAINHLLTWYYNNNSQLFDMYGFDLLDDTSAQIGYNAIHGNTYLSSDFLPFKPFINDFSDGLRLFVSIREKGEDVVIGPCKTESRQILAADKMIKRIYQ